MRSREVGSAGGVEEALSGGNMGGALRVGDSVRRPAGAWTPTIQRLLGHLHQHGLTWMPAPLGRDEHGRDSLTHLPGVVPQYPLPEWVWHDDILTTAAGLMAQLHDASAGFDTRGAIWQLPAHQPEEVICHNDFAPDNMVFTNERLTAIIDWDTASPGPRVWDLAYLAYRLLPLTAPANGDGLASSHEERARRLRLLCGAYGYPVDPAEVLAVTVVRLHELAAFTEARAKDGDERLASHAELYRSDARWIDAHSRHLIHAA